MSCSVHQHSGSGLYSEVEHVVPSRRKRRRATAARLIYFLVSERGLFFARRAAQLVRSDLCSVLFEGVLRREPREGREQIYSQRRKEFFCEREGYSKVV
jgi:hypothetical protein